MHAGDVQVRRDHPQSKTAGRWLADGEAAGIALFTGLSHV